MKSAFAGFSVLFGVTFFLFSSLTLSISEDSHPVLFSGIDSDIGYEKHNLPDINYQSFSVNPSATRLYVDSAASGLNNGLTWMDAFTSLSEALDSARSCDIDSILVAKGTYIPQDSLGSAPVNPRRKSFTLSEDMVMLGGFSPLNGATELFQRDWQAYPTTLSGDLMQDDSTNYSSIIDLTDRPERDTNAYHIVAQIDIKTSDRAIIDGFYFVGGNANANVMVNEAERGGGIYLDSSKLRIYNCLFQFNSANIEGGAVFIDTSSSLRLSNVFFISNFADEFGGAISSQGQLMADSSFYSFNVSHFEGGAVSTSDSCHISYSTFEHNEVLAFDGLGGAIGAFGCFQCNGLANVLIIENCRFTANSAAAGGAIGWLGDSLSVTSSVVDSNMATEAGGGFLIVGDVASVDDCQFYNNGAFAGGAIHAGFPESIGGDAKEEAPRKMMPQNPDFRLDISSSVFEGDTATFGGAVALFLYDVRVDRSIFRGNMASEYGGAVEVLDGIYTGTNNLYSGNYAATGGGAITSGLFFGEGPGIPQFKSNTENRRRSKYVNYSKRKTYLKSMDFDFSKIGRVKLTNSTFTSNLTNGLGGALNFFDTQDTLTNVIIWDNQDETGLNTDSAGVFVEIIAPINTGETVFKNCLVQGSNGSGGSWSINNGVDDGGNIDADPIFVFPINPSVAPHVMGDYSIICPSPAIDAGVLDTVGLDIGILDIAGISRVVNSIIDIGAYEYRKGGPNGNIVYVDSSATLGANNGQSWDDAFLELSDALSLSCLAPGDTIYVARGTYYPDTNGLSDPREATFELRDSIVLLGGFAPDLGVDSSFERDWDLYQSITSGDIGVKGDSIDNAYSVITADFRNGNIDITPAAIVDGFYIQDGVGNKDGSVINGRFGGGMFCWRTNPTLRNLTFRNNTTIGGGGGLYTILRDITIENSHFVNNSAVKTETTDGSGGGAIIADGRLIMTNSSFIGNNAHRSAGLLLTYQNSNAVDTSEIYNCLFKENVAVESVGALNSDGLHVKIVQSKIINNSARSSPAFQIIGGSMKVINSLLYGNLSNNGSNDISISIASMPDSSLNFINSILWANGSRQNSNRILFDQSGNAATVTTFQNCLVEFGLDDLEIIKSGFGIDLGGNLDEYPEFTDTTNCDFRLLCLSPAIDAGTADTTGLCLTQLDFIDSSRVVGKFIDIGPYEVQEDCIAIEVSDVAFGEVCDTTTLRTFIKNVGVGDLTIDEIVSSDPLFSFDDMMISFPLVVPYCDSFPLDVSYNSGNLGSDSGTLTITSNAININPVVINLTAVTDTTAPVISCLDTTIYLDATGMFAIDTSFVLDSYSDNCDIDTVYVSQSDFNCNHVGTNVVTVTVSDNKGNTNTCESTVTVRDTISPVAICQNITVYVDDVGEVSISPADIDNGSTDACGILSLEIDTSDFDCMDVGANTVVLTVTDVNGNMSTCSGMVTVIDTVSPVMICQNYNLYLDVTGQALLMIENVNNGSNDNCSPIELGISQEEFGCEDIGLNEVVLSGSDNSENSSSCIAVVTVIDTVSPIANCQDFVAYLDASGMVNIVSDDIDNNSSDACGLASIALNRTDFSCNDVGLNQVILTVEDVNGNISTCMSNVTVVDTISPVISCEPFEVTLDLSGNSTVTLTDLNVSSNDACGIKSVSISRSEFTCEDIGANEVIITAIDQNDNVSTCTTIVTVNPNLETFNPEIIGPKTLCDSLINIPYSISDKEGVTFQWAYSGSGVTIKDNGNHEVFLDFGIFTEGVLSVTMINGCSDEIGMASFDIILGGDEFCELATCLREFAFVSNEVLDIDGSIDVYKVSKRIKSEAELMAPRSLIFKAGETVELDAPFSVADGSVFVAEIEACEAAMEAFLIKENGKD